MKMTTTVSTNRIKPTFKGHTTNKRKTYYKCLDQYFFRHPTFTVKKCVSDLTHIVIYSITTGIGNVLCLLSILPPHSLDAVPENDPVL